MTKETGSKTVLDSEEWQTSERNRHIRNWIGGKFGKWSVRGLMGGLGSTLMALPALAQATSAELEAFQFVTSIPGVRSAKLLANGDVQLKLTDGRTVVIAAENAQVLENGSIMIADDAAAQVAQFSAVAEVGAATAATGGVSSTGLLLGGLGVAGAAAAAGGGGGGGDEDNSDRTPDRGSGKGGNKTDPTTQPEPPVEPPLPTLNLAELQGGTLSNLSTEVTTPDGTTSVEVSIGGITKSTTPDLDGNWSVSLTQAEAEALPQGASIVTVRNLDGDGAELSTGAAEFNVDTVPPTVSITSVSTGHSMNADEQDGALSVSGSTDAENGQIVTVEINGQTYSGVVAGGSWSVTIPSDDLASLPNASTIGITADVADRAGNPASQANSSFDTDFTPPTLSLNAVAGGSIDLIDVSGDLTISGTTNAEDGQTVDLDFNGQQYTGTTSGGNWSVTIPNADLTGLSTGTPVDVSVALSDAAGNPATPVSVTVPVDLTGPSISIAPLPTGGTLNAAEAGSDLIVSGATANVTDGQVVTVTLNGQTYTDAVSSGAWSVTIPNTDLAALADGGTFSITADVSDSDGLPAPQTSADLSKDVTPPTLSIDTFSHGAVLNAIEQASDLTISGATNAEDGQTVTVTLNGKSYTGTALSGAWSTSVPSADLGALADGATVSVTADVTDSAGNPAIQATNSFSTDFTAPSLAVSSLSPGVAMNASERASDFVVTGSSNAENGSVVSVTVTRADGTVDLSGTATVNAGAWTYTAAAASLAALQDGETYDVNVSVTDAAGNMQNATGSFSTDFTVPTLTIDPLSTGSILDVIERDSNLEVSGATSAEDGQIVTVSLGTATYTTTTSGGLWSATIPSADLNALTDTTAYTLTASVSDSAGNAAVDATTAFSTDFKPILELDGIGQNGATSLADAQASGVAVSGTSAGLSAGQNVDILLNGNPAGSATVAADGSWNLNVPASNFSGMSAGDVLAFSAQATVSGGPDPSPVSDQVVAHSPTAYVITQAGQSGSTVTFEIHADTGRDTSSGLAFTATMGFDPSVVSFDTGSVVENSDFNLFLANPSGGNAINFGGAATSYSDLSTPIVTFNMTVLDTSQPIELTLTTPDGGPSNLFLGTSGSDSIMGTNLDDVVRGGDGDDAIDLNGAGRDIVVFESDPADNGFDIVSGFTLGPAASISDALMFSGLDTSSLRGSGTGFETLSTGDQIDTNTGFVGLETILTDLNSATIETAAESLTDVQVGDEIYVLATDGTDSALVKVEYTGPNNASVETLAQFDGLSDLSNLSADNILLSDPTGASA